MQPVCNLAIQFWVGNSSKIAIPKILINFYYVFIQWNLDKIIMKYNIAWSRGNLTEFCRKKARSR